MKTQANRWLRGCVTVALSVAGILFGGTSALATIIATDDASNSPYTDGWGPGDDGGTGWGAGGWTFRNQSNTILTTTNGNRGWFRGSSLNNNNGGADLPSPGDFDIDTPSDSNGVAWGVYSNATDQVYAIRPLNGSMLIGDTISWYMDNGGISASNVVGMRFLSDATDINSRVFEVRFVGGQSNYSVVDSVGQTLSSIGFTRQGLYVEYTLTGANTYSLKVQRLENGNVTPIIQTITGTNVNANSINAIAFKNQLAGSGAANDAFLNRLTQVRTIPEASAIWLCGLTLCYLLCPSRCRAE